MPGWLIACVFVIIGCYAFAGAVNIPPIVPLTAATLIVAALAFLIPKRS